MKFLKNSAIEKPLFIYHGVLITGYLILVFSMDGENREIEISDQAKGFGCMLSYIVEGIRRHGLIDFIFMDRYFIHSCLKKLMTQKQFIFSNLLFSSAGWIFLARAYASLIENKPLRESFFILILLFSLSYHIQFWNMLVHKQGTSNILNVYALIPVPYLFRSNKNYFIFLAMCILIMIIAVLTRQANIYLFPALLTTLICALIMSATIKKHLLRTALSVLAIVSVIILISANTPKKNISYAFDMIICNRIFNPFKAYSLSFFKSFKQRYKENNIKYFRDKYGIDYILS